jgi:hypothetical protein
MSYLFNNLEFGLFLSVLAVLLIWGRPLKNNLHGFSTSHIYSNTEEKGYAINRRCGFAMMAAGLIIAITCLAMMIAHVALSFEVVTISIGVEFILTAVAVVAVYFYYRYRLAVH